MILTALIVAMGFVWLGIETDWLTVRLPYGAPQRQNSPVKQSTNIERHIDFSNPYWWQSPEHRQANMLLCVGCRLNCKERKSERWAGWKLPAKSIKAFDSTMNLESQCNIFRANFLKSLARAYNRKPSMSNAQAPFPVFITSRLKPLADDIYNHETVYHDCLPGKAWLKKHSKDVLPEPTIEIMVAGELKASIDGNYKRGMIKELMSQHTRKTKRAKVMC